eukprot:TRINITY_DN102916_c0_g1_i1.p1 TRINITY_DN102916_c0_g1~~TRINITY_DN102916_c0_g1_i1.p1  ORF type:complete len:816 (-),score=140.72 TRINITY_DN102916_c0_g1_i1:43-2439(-)
MRPPLTLLRSSPMPLSDRGIGVDVQTWLRWLETSMGNHTASDLARVRENSESDMQTMVQASWFNSFALLAVVALFLMLRALVPHVYWNSAGDEASAADETSPSFAHTASSFQHRIVSGVHHLLCVQYDEDLVLSRAGLDGQMFIEFIKLARRICLVIGSVLLLFICPLHYTYHPERERASLLSQIGIDALTLSGASQGRPLILMWAHVVAVWFVVLATSFMVYNAQVTFLQLRFKWLKNIPMPRATTLMVENLTPDVRSDASLYRYFARLFSEEAVERAYVVRKTDRLQQLVKEEEAIISSLRVAEASWENSDQDPARRPTVTEGFFGFGASEDAIEFHTRALALKKTEVQAERDRVEANIQAMVRRTGSCTGFVTFSSRRLCMLASRQQYRADALELKVTMPPEPDDIIYTDLAKDPMAQQGGNIAATLLLALIFITWMPLVVTVSGATSLPVLRQTVPGLDAACNKNPQMAHLVEGVLGTLALKVFMAFLPTLFMLIIGNVLTLKAKTWAQLKLQDWYFSFLVTFVLLVTSLGRTLIGSIFAIIKQPTAALVLLSRKLPQSSNFYINYIMLGCLLQTFELLRIIQLAKYFLNRLQGFKPEEARMLAEPEDQDTSGMGARMAKAALTLVIALVFCSCSPIIMVFASVYFSIGSYSYGYLVVCAETKKPDMGGAFWVKALGYIFRGLLIYVLLMTGMITRVAAPSKLAAPVVLTLAALLPLGLAAWRFGQLTWESLPFEAIAQVDFRESRQGGSRRRYGEYLQPECRGAEGSSGGKSLQRAEEEVDETPRSEKREDGS